MTETETAGPWSDCAICETIWRGFTRLDEPHISNHRSFDEYTLSLGSFDDAKNFECPRHRPLLEQFRDVWRKDGYETDDFGFEVSKRDGVHLVESLSKGGISWCLLLVKKVYIPNHIGTGRLLNPDWGDISVIKDWKNRCLSLHGGRCQNPMKIWRTRPAWVLDIETKCLVLGKDCASFVALSYRWGRGGNFKVDVNTLALFLMPKALDTPEIAESLPPIIHRAMYLTSILGERYLWIDALCIVHGDSATTAAELNLMSAIYASAVITLIAADGDSLDGLPGLPSVSPPRNLQQRVIPFGSESVVVRNTRALGMTQGTPYYHRGWTYQEYTMSTRKILFNRQELHWQCQCSVWHEETTLGTEIDMRLDPRFEEILAGFPDPTALFNILSMYNTLELRYDEDALPGVSGLLSIFSRSFLGGFLYGIPEMLFDRALGWSPASYTDLQRRVPSDRPGHLRLSDATLPSWSWIGWRGPITVDLGEAARINRWAGEIHETIPITEWYTSNSPRCSAWRRIRSTWFENRDSYKDLTIPLPAGWTRHEIPVHEPTKDEPFLYPDGCGVHVFRHCNMPDDGQDNECWYYPFPVPDIQETTEPFIPEQTAYISCQTKRAWLWGRQTEDFNLVELCNRSGDHIGSLQVHNREQLNLFPRQGADNISGQPIELVAIYLSRIYGKIWDEDQITDDARSITERYQVLWVDWADGVASRLAIGHVGRDDWEQLDLEEVLLILG